MDNTTIQKFLDEHDYDIRKTHNGRWIDQKCTMDVVCLVSDCIVEYTSNREDKRFTVNDIWYSDIRWKMFNKFLANQILLRKHQMNMISILDSQ